MVQAGNGVNPPVLKRGRHAVSVARLGKGVEEVTFDRDVSACSYQATLGGAEPIVSPGLGLPTSVTVNPKSGAPNTVFVGVSSISGGSVDPSDSSFHLLVAC